jgi:hypothetical protein
MECSGAYAVFDGIGSPVTQTFGLGIFEELTAASLDVIERFFLDRGAQVDHEVSPLVGVAALNLLCSRQYRPIEISNVMYRPTEKPAAEDHGNIKVRVTGPEEAQLWTDTSAKGWTHEHPELLGFILQTSAISSAREQSILAGVWREPELARQHPNGESDRSGHLYAWHQRRQSLVQHIELRAADRCSLRQRGTEQHVRTGIVQQRIVQKLDEGWFLNDDCASGAPFGFLVKNYPKPQALDFIRGKFFERKNPPSGTNRVAVRSKGKGVAFASRSHSNP